ncbi:MAG: DUF5916 domain-containing protein [Saprospiraceae bacterium]
MNHYFVNKTIIIGILICTTSSLLLGQSPNEAKYHIDITPCISPIMVNGVLDDKGWDGVTELSRFHQNFPYDTVMANQQTRVKVTHDDQYFYVSAICYQNKYVVRSLRRDFDNSSTDIFTILIDPFRDKLNGYYFAVSPYGVQKEQLIYNGNETNVNWDNKWYADVVRYDDRYEVEIAIPFKTLRYQNNGDVNTWNVNFFRNNNIDNERSCWAPIPRNFRLLDITFNGSMTWQQKPPDPGSNIAIIPYAAREINKNFINNTPSNARFNFGMDAKIGIGTSLNLDLTINPDFSQVEVDRQITDLSRFELFFPERRQFFLENNDLFSQFGASNANPFFSRRIGIYNNPQTRNNVQIPIIAGARLSGRINDKLRVGFMNMQTASSQKDSLPSVNYTVLAMQKKVGVRSNLAFIMVNKESLLNMESSTSLLSYNRVAGMEYNYGSADGSINGKVFYHQGFTPRDVKEEYSMGANISIIKSNIQFSSNIYQIGNNYLPEVGFSPRLGVLRQSSNLDIIFFPKGKWSSLINSIRITPDYDLFYRKIDKRVTDWDAGLFFTIQFQNNAELSGTFLRWDFTYLFSDFDPTNKYEDGFQILKQGSQFTYFSNRLNFRSNFAKPLNYSFEMRVGNYFNGSIFNLQSSLSYRWQPYASISSDINYNRIRMPVGYNNADFWLVGPRVDVTFTRTLFLTTLVQYNNQSNNINTNTRLQWRFAPVSDFFLVYTDNYFAQDDPLRSFEAFGKKNRAVVAKFTYWLNI